MTENENRAWFCVRSQPKHEHIAAAHLRKMDDIEVFLPRIRFKRAIQRKPVWVMEALFPNYFFARFEWEVSHREVHYACGVRNIVHFGRYFPAIPDETIETLRRGFGPAELRTIPEKFSPGDAVQIAGGALFGLQAVVANVIPCRERIAVLMDFLGRQTLVELTSDAVIRQNLEHRAVF